VLLAFRAWRGSLPWFPIATRAYVAVAMLVEMLADDRARRVVSDLTLTQSIAIVGAGQLVVDGATLTPPGSERAAVLAADTPSATRRIARLAEEAAPLASPGRAIAVGLAVALIAIPTVLLLAPLA
jgi:hypothetical protein